MLKIYGQVKILKVCLQAYKSNVKSGFNERAGKILKIYNF